MVSSWNGLELTATSNSSSSRVKMVRPAKRVLRRVPVELHLPKDRRLGRSTPPTGLRTGTMSMIHNVSHRYATVNSQLALTLAVQAWQATQYGQQGAGAQTPAA